MRKAYSYQRFSSIRQKAGDSTKRQTEAVEMFCKQHELVLADTFRDEGVSGFKGRNFSNESALSQFLKLVENGTVQEGSCLVIENMDRLSRQSILPCLSKFIEIINMGVSIGVISQNKILDAKSITGDPTELMLVLVEFARANNESETKSKRAKSVINKKIELVKQGQKVWFGVQKPSWVIGLKNGKFLLDEERVNLVKAIFNQYLAGHSCSHIADNLNQSKTPTLRGLKNGMWTNTTVAELLRNKNVTGWFGINGIEVDDYFPEIIALNTFQLVQQKLAFNVKNRGGSKYGLVRNLFKGLLTCAKCGQAIETKIGTYRSVKGTVNHYANYICRGVKNKNGCTNKGRVDVADFEAKMFQHVLNLNDFFKQSPTADGTLTVLESKLARTRNAIDRAMKLLESDELQDLAQLRTNLARLNKEQIQLLKDIETKKAKVSAITNSPKVIQLLRDKISGHVTSVDLDTGELVKEDIILMPNDPKMALKLLDEELARIKEHLKATETRMVIRNVMPTVFDAIRIQFGNKVKAHCQFVNGNETTVVIESENPSTLQN